MKITQIPSSRVFLNKIKFLSKFGFYPSACIFCFVLFCFFCLNNAPLTLPKAFRTDANSKEWSSFTLSLNIFNLGLPSYHRGFLGTLTFFTPKKKCTYMQHTISPVKTCCSQQFGHLQRNVCRLHHTSQTSIQDEIWPLLPITITSLPPTQKHFHWVYTYIHTCGTRSHCTIRSISYNSVKQW